MLVTSSLAWFPGLPVHVSTDLGRWDLASHVLTAPDPRLATGPKVEDGVWAPTVRSHGDRLYVVFTVSLHRRDHTTWVTTAPDAEGPWTTPTRLDADGFDPSLFFDADGSAWLTACRDTTTPGRGPGEIWLQRFDAEALALVGSRRVIWHGATPGLWVEAPHLYRRGSRYLLLAAEGGTGRDHAVVGATAGRLSGPWRATRRNPLLTHRDLAADVQNVGHADLVESPDGRGWAVVLGARVAEGFHTTGRETFVVPVDWHGAVPVLAPGHGRVPHVVDLDDEPLAPDATAPLQWSSLHGPAAIRAEPDGWAMHPSPVPLTGGGTPAFLAVAQDEPAFRFEARIDGAGAATAAGVVAFHDESRFVTLEIAPPTGDVRCVLWIGGTPRLLGSAPAATRLAIASDGVRYRFLADDAFVADLDARLLSTEYADGFGGTSVGIVALGPVTEPEVRFSMVRFDRGAARQQRPLITEGVR